MSAADLLEGREHLPAGAIVLVSVKNEGKISPAVGHASALEGLFERAPDGPCAE